LLSAIAACRIRKLRGGSYYPSRAIEDLHRESYRLSRLYRRLLRHPILRSRVREARRSIFGLGCAIEESGGARQSCRRVVGHLDDCAFRTLPPSHCPESELILGG